MIFSILLTGATLKETPPIWQVTWLYTPHIESCLHHTHKSIVSFPQIRSRVLLSTHMSAYMNKWIREFMSHVSTTYRVMSASNKHDFIGGVGHIRTSHVKQHDSMQTWLDRWRVHNTYESSVHKCTEDSNHTSLLQKSPIKQTLFCHIQSSVQPDAQRTQTSYERVTW